MKFTLLTHFKELTKKSNTGRLVVDLLGDEVACQVRWDRMNPPAALLEEIESGGVALIYPGAPEERDGDFSDISHCILIDGTWHEARKIHQRSPYLHGVRRIRLRPVGISAYNLRRNQKSGCLCTVECVIEILRAVGNHADAERLQESFQAFIRPPGTMRGEVQRSHD